MTDKQREYLAKTLADVGKGLLLAAVIGIGTDKITVMTFVLDLIGAGYALIAGYLLEGRENDTNQSP